MRILISLCMLCVLVSCSITKPRDVGNANMITLSAPTDIAPMASKRGALKVDYPTAPSDLDTYRIAVAKADGRQDYFAGARWNEFLPSVVQSALTEALSKSGRFSYVDPDDASSTNKYVLHVDIEECKAVYAADKLPPKALIRIVFHLSAGYSDRTIMTFTLEEQAQAANNTLASISKAFNAAFGSIATQAIARLQTVK